MKIKGWPEIPVTKFLDNIYFYPMHEVQKVMRPPRLHIGFNSRINSYFVYIPAVAKVLNFTVFRCGSLLQILSCSTEDFTVYREEKCFEECGSGRLYLHNYVSLKGLFDFKGSKNGRQTRKTTTIVVELK